MIRISTQNLNVICAWLLLGLHAYFTPAGLYYICRNEGFRFETNRGAAASVGDWQQEK